MTKTRYLVEWTPWAEVHAAARKAGMVAGGEVNDFVDAEDYDVSRVFRSLALAAAFAKDVAPSDTWHCPRIRRQAWVQNDHDDLGNRVGARPDWETEATWEVSEDTDLSGVVDSSPDWTA